MKAGTVSKSGRGGKKAIPVPAEMKDKAGKSMTTNSPINSGKATVGGLKMKSKDQKKVKMNAKGKG